MVLESLSIYYIISAISMGVALIALLAVEQYAAYKRRQEDIGEPGEDRPLLVTDADAKKMGSINSSLSSVYESLNQLFKEKDEAALQSLRNNLLKLLKPTEQVWFNSESTAEGPGFTGHVDISNRCAVKALKLIYQGIELEHTPGQDGQVKIGQARHYLKIAAESKLPGDFGSLHWYRVCLLLSNISTKYGQEQFHEFFNFLRDMYAESHNEIGKSFFLNAMKEHLKLCFTISQDTPLRKNGNALFQTMKEAITEIESDMMPGTGAALCMTPLVLAANHDESSGNRFGN